MHYKIINLTEDGCDQYWDRVDSNTVEAVRKHVAKVSKDQHSEHARYLREAAASGGMVRFVVLEQGNVVDVRVYEVKPITTPTFEVVAV